MTITDADGAFVSAGGLPTRITQPEPSPLTLASGVQARAARTLATLRVELDGLASQLRPQDARRAPQALIPADIITQLLDRLAVVTQTLSEIEQAANSARSTIDKLRAERGQLQALFVIAEHLNATIDRPALLVRMLDDVLTLVRGDRGGIFLVDANGQLRFEAARHRDRQSLPPGDNIISRAAVELCWQRQQTVLVPQTGTDPAMSRDAIVKQQGIHSVMCAPFRTQQQVMGIAYVDRRETPGGFTADDIDLLAAFCNIGTISLESANHFVTQQVQLQAIAAMKNYTDSILASVASGVIALDNQGRVTRINPAALRLLNAEERAVQGKTYSIALQSVHNRTIVDRMLKTLETPNVHETMFTETQITGRDKPLKLNVTWSALQGPEQQRLGTVIVIDDLTALSEEREAAQRVERYVHPNVIELVKQHPSAAVLGGATREISIIFADLRDFTKLGEALKPAPLFELLNTYLNLLSEIVFAEGGTVTMFQGDAVMAIFNAPADQPDHPLRAIRAGWAMRTALNEQHARTGYKPLHFGIGLNLGSAYVGNIGHSRIQNYTAIGDAVNTAKRIEEQARENRVLVSDVLYRRVASAVHVAPSEPLVAKGKAQPMAVWELRGIR